MILVNLVFFINDFMNGIIRANQYQGKFWQILHNRREPGQMYLDFHLLLCFTYVTKKKKFRHPNDEEVMSMIGKCFNHRAATSLLSIE